MFNIKQFNLNQFNSWIVGITGVISGDITYWGYILHKTDNIHLNFADINNWSSIEANTYNLPNIDWIGLNSYFKRVKSVVVRWTLKWSNKEDLENRMKNMLFSLSKPNQTLQVLNAWTYQRAKAYVTNLDNIFSREHYNNTFIPFEINFVVSSPFWESIELNAITYNITTALQEEIISLWTARTEPVITLSFNTTNSTEINIVFWEFDLTITKTLVDNDIIRIDSITKQVLLNWVEIDYIWQLPFIEVWSNTFTITPNWVFDCDVSINYRNKFI